MDLSFNSVLFAFGLIFFAGLSIGIGRLIGFFILRPVIFGIVFAAVAGISV